METINWEQLYRELRSATAEMCHAQIEYFDARKRGYNADTQLAKAKRLENKVHAQLKAGKKMLSEIDDKVQKSLFN